MKRFDNLNIFACIGIIVVSMILGAIIAKSHMPLYESYETQNAILLRQADSLKHVANQLQDEAKAYQAVIIKYKSSLDSLKSIQFLNRQKHESQIVRIDAMPADSLYLFFTEYTGQQ